MELGKGEVGKEATELQQITSMLESMSCRVDDYTGRVCSFIEGVRGPTPTDPENTAGEDHGSGTLNEAKNMLGTLERRINDLDDATRALIDMNL